MPSILDKPLTPTTKLFRVLLLPLVFIPTVLIIIPLFALLIPAYPILVTIALIKRRRFMRALHKQNRIIDLPTASSRVQSANGTLLVELHEHGVGDTWWIDADFSNENCPLPLASKLSDGGNNPDLWETVLYKPETSEWLKDKMNTNPTILFVHTPRHFWKAPHPEIAVTRARLISYRANNFLNATT